MSKEYNKHDASTSIVFSSASLEDNRDLLNLNLGAKAQNKYD